MSEFSLLIYLLDVADGLNVIFTIAAIILAIWSAAWGFIVFAARDDGDNETSKLAASIVVRSIPFLAVVLTAMVLIPSRETMVGIVLAERASFGPTSPAFETWLQRTANRELRDMEQEDQK
jgi:hypothetical protein